MVVGVAAACTAMLWVLSHALRNPEPENHFATLEEVRSARWDGSDLPTTAGSRLGRGTLRLTEGMAKIRFDSGVDLTLESPAELVLSDAMNCTLNSGTALTHVPDSAIGFRVETPSATVIDHGTRFSVKVDSASGRTHTHVYEGHVEVQHRESGETVSLRDGQSQSSHGAGPGTESYLIGPPGRGPGWRLLETHKDAYIGSAYADGAEVHRSDTLLLLKNGSVDRKAYLGFDLTGIDADAIENAELTLHFAPTGWGVASLVPDATFSIHGLVAREPWDEDSLKARNAPANLRSRGRATPRTMDGTLLDPAKVRDLGSFEIEQGVQKGAFGIEGRALADFLREQAGGEVALIVTRETRELDRNGLVHGFASRRHPTLRAPTLAIRLSEP